MCGQLNNVFRAVDHFKYQDLMFDEIIKLINDEEVDIQSEASSLLIDTLDLY
jgi:hypothetical protein